jgi:hypothetical protein
MNRYILKDIRLLLSLFFGLMCSNPLNAQNNISLSFTTQCSYSSSCNVFYPANTTNCSGFKLTTSHGSPRYDIYADDIKAIRLEGRSGGEEGFFLDYKFLSGNSYLIELTVQPIDEQGYTSTYLKVDLANGVTTQNDECNFGTAPTVSDVASVFNTNQYTNQSNQISKSVVPSTNYNQLWLRSTKLNTAVTGVWIFRIKITETVNSQPVNITGNTICCAQTICSGSVPAILGQASGTSLGGATTYAHQWQSSTDGTNFTSISPAVTSATYQPPTLTQSTWYRRVVNGSSFSTPVKITVIPANITVATTNYSTNTTVKAASSITIQGDQTPGAGITATFTAGSSITINPNTTLSPNISLTIAPCTSGGRIAYWEDSEVESENKEYMKAYPNPAIDKVTVELLFEPRSETLIRIHDSYGKEINSAALKKLNDSLYEVDMVGQGSGMYFIRVLAPEGWVNKKIVLTK